MRILVTGGSGFIGTRIVRGLRDHGVTVIDKNISEVDHRADIRNKEEINRVFSKEKPEYVIHLAAEVDTRISMEKPESSVETNVIGTLNVLDACRSSGTKNIVFASSAAVYGEPQYIPVDEKHDTLPVSIYGATKLISEKYIEMYCRAYGMKYVILRYANVYGPESKSVISIFIERMLKGERPMIFGNGSQKRDYIYVDDVVSATIAAVKKADGMTLNISTATETSVKDVYNIISEHVKPTKPIFKKESRGEINSIRLDNSMAKKYLNWTPKTDLATGIAKIIAVMRK